MDARFGNAYRVAGGDNYGRPCPQIDELRSLFKSGRLSAIGEVTAQYEGLSPSDPALQPYFALAEELDIPVGIHTGTSFPGTPYQGYPRFRLALGNPLLLEDLLVRHPKLRVFIAHGGEPWRRETIALMGMYQQGLHGCGHDLAPGIVQPIGD